MGKADAREHRNWSVCLPAAFLLLVLALAWLGTLAPYVPCVYLFASAAAFVLYGADKLAARKNRRRVRERTLHLAGFFGGWPGALLAQRFLRHKSQKASFQFAFRLTALANCAVLALLVFTPAGRWGR